MEDGPQGEQTVPGSVPRLSGRSFDQLWARAAGRTPHRLRAFLHRDACLARCPSPGVGGRVCLRVLRPGGAVAQRLVCAPAGPMALADRACPPRPMRLVWLVAARRRAYPDGRRQAWHRGAAHCVALRYRSAVHAYLAARRRAGYRVVLPLRGRWLLFRVGCRPEEKRAEYGRTMAGSQRRDEAGSRIGRRRPCLLRAHPWRAAQRF
jgi:hypothetical protein